MEKKFKLTEETINVYGITLYRIEAIISFGNISAGEKAGMYRKKRMLANTVMQGYTVMQRYTVMQLLKTKAANHLSHIYPSGLLEIIDLSHLKDQSA